MKFRVHKLKPGWWVDQDSGQRIDGSVGLEVKEIIEAKTVREAMKMLRSYWNPSPILSVVGQDEEWARRAVERLVS